MTTQRRPSVFAQRMQSLREIRGTDITKDCTPVVHKKIEFVAEVKMKSVSSENETLLTSLSKTEIEKEQQELRRVLRPEIVAFLKNRAEKESLSSHSLENNKYRIREASEGDTDKNNALNLHMESKNDGVHPVEREKMKWIEDIPIPVKPLPDVLYNARFDFYGNLLPYIVENESTNSKGLYHHGVEPERPGYTLEELFQLSRSSFPRQRVIALNTIAAILENELLLSSCLETDLFSELLNSGLFLILRFALDERLKSVYLAALRAITALLWREVDMHYLTESIGIFGDMRLPSFEVVHSVLDGGNLEELKDSELLMLDLIRGSLRTNLVQRLKYVLDDMYPVDDRVLPIIKCLTRIAFHSDEAVQVILNTTLLLEKLFAICGLPVESEFGKLRVTTKFLILLRVIACRSQEFAETLCSRFHLVSYLLNTVGGDSVTRTTVASQCLSLWHVLLYRDIALESVSEFSPVLYDLLRQIANKSVERLEDGDAVLANTLVTLLIFLFEKFPETVAFLRPILERLCCQWLQLFVSGVQDSRNFVKLISNCIYLLTCTNAADEKSEFVTSLFKILTWDRLLPLSEQLPKASYLLKAVKTNYVQSLPSLCVPPSILIANNSNLLLIHAVVKCLLQNVIRFHACEEQITLIDNLWRFYVLPVLERSDINQIAIFWPARLEILFLYDILLLFRARQRTLSVERQKHLLRLAFALLRIIHTDDGALTQPIFDEILFNEYLHDRITSSSFSSVEMSDGDLFVDEERSQKLNTEYVDIVKQIFADYLHILPKSEATALISTKRGTECAMPTDWFYIPILKVSNEFHDNRRTHRLVTYENANTTTKIMENVLQWIRFVELVADDVKTEMSLSTRFCRMCCVFFCGDVFLELGNVLSDILRFLLRRNDQLDFNTTIPGLSSFYDFYRELCEQFASCSYGDRVFASYLLVPLQQKHDVRFRLHFWNEQTAVLRFFKLTIQQLPVPLHFYLQPSERNVQLIEIYLNVIAKGQISEKTSPALYRIGLHHIASFLQSYEEESIAKRLRQKVDRIGNEYLKNNILNYRYEDFL